MTKLRCKKTTALVDRLKIDGKPQPRWLCPACKRYHTIDELEPVNVNEAVEVEDMREDRCFGVRRR